MTLEEKLLLYLGTLGSIRTSNSFGWICIYTGKNLFAGYQVVDNDILILWLILSPSGFEKALQNGFQKFDFGKTWAETEIAGEDDLTRILPFVESSFHFTEERRNAKKIKKVISPKTLF